MPHTQPILRKIAQTHRNLQAPREVRLLVFLVVKHVVLQKDDVRVGFVAIRRLADFEKARQEVLARAARRLEEIHHHERLARVLHARALGVGALALAHMSALSGMQHGQ